MVLRRKLMLAGAVATVGISALGVGAASAAQNNTGNDNLVSKIASKFNLNKDDVQKVFDEQHAANQAEHKQKLEDRLGQAVKDGKLTEDQKSKLLAKFDEEKSFRDSLKDKTQDERKAAMKQHRTDMEAWAKANGIDMKFLRPHGGPHGPGGRPGSHDNDSEDEGGNPDQQ